MIKLSTQFTKMKRYMKLHGFCTIYVTTYSEGTYGMKVEEMTKTQFTGFNFKTRTANHVIPVEDIKEIIIP